MKETCGQGAGGKSLKQTPGWETHGGLSGDSNDLGRWRFGMDRHRALVIPGFLVLSSSRRNSRDKRARFAPFTDSIPPLACPLFFPNEMQETCGRGQGERA
ncbi:hypothetical protein KQI74_09260 [Paenibacillus barcinonensis]|uniref:hypothetical protein n=1 Tax=Paenibacillus barcinonensis TaxID=198119 RepID=UPI001C1163BB|nr:hypothetical protein [Paenibacillus barcinonensis]MBU5352466.1 hypothetical protein [Paenibacillus barcinonensis]